jgi:hypothetical protein
MAAVADGAVSENGGVYRRHRPEDTLLYQIVAEHYPIFADLMRAQGPPLPSFVQRQFEDYLKCRRLEYGFLRVRCSTCHAEKLVAFRCKRRGFCPSGGARRMVDTAALLVDEVLPPVPIRQWVLSVPIPLRMLFLDGVYGTGGPRPRFIPLPSPTPAVLQALWERITHRVGRHLECRGLLVRDAESAHLQWDDEDARPLDELLGAAVTYRIAVVPQRGQKAFTLQTLVPAPVDIEVCEHCGGTVRIIASIEDPAVIEKILAYIERRDAAAASHHAPRAPPASSGGDSP